jgi:hypothetical protein
LVFWGSLIDVSFSAMAYRIFCNTSKLLVTKTKTLHDLLPTIGSIVARHGGIMELDATSKTIDVMVPQKQEALCTREIGEWLSAMSH